MSDEIDRRTLLALAALTAAGTASKAWPAEFRPDEKQQGVPTVAMLAYPKMVALDLIGPLTVFKIAGFNTMLVWKDKTPAMTDIGLPRSTVQKRHAR